MVVPVKESVKGQVGHSVRAAKTGELIAAHLRGLIVRGELAEGDSLPSEVELMEQFEVSRPTLREAFRILETESLIMIRRGSRGARILAPQPAVAARYVGLLLQFSGTTLDDVYQARSVLEPLAAARLATRRTEQDLADLTRCIDVLAAMLVDSAAVDVGSWSQATHRFHEMVVARAGNQTLALQSTVLNEVVTTHLSTLAHRPGDRARTLREFRRGVRSYRKLVVLLAARDAPGAEEHWRAHMVEAAHGLLRGDLRSTTVLDLFN